MSHVNRAELLRQLENVRAGLSPQEVYEQSSCFVFRNGRVLTFNNEVACRAATDLEKSFTGAVKAAPLLAILEKLSEDDVDLEVVNDELVILGKRKEVGIRMESEITLGVDVVEKPTEEWLNLPDDFGEAVSMVQECAKMRDEVPTNFALTCIHMHPQWLEATDNFQMARYTIKTGIKKATLVKRVALRHITFLRMRQFSETEKWIHFKNADGVIMSCRRYTESYKDLGRGGTSGIGLNSKGEPATLPKGLIEACDKADVFSSENTDNNRVLISIRPGELRVKAHGASGRYTETKKCGYDGPPISFMVSPKLMIELTKKQIECEVSSKFIKAQMGKLTYLAWVYEANPRPALPKEADHATDRDHQPKRSRVDGSQRA